MKIDQVEDCKSKIQRFEIQPESTILAESWGILTRVYLPRPVILVPLGHVRLIVQWELGPSIAIVKIRDYIIYKHCNLYRTRLDPQDLATYI
jgi:hypothetical protein